VTVEQILATDPHLTAEDISAELHHAAKAAKEEHRYPLPVRK
jgi:hypothetical protein